MSVSVHVTESAKKAPHPGIILVSRPAQGQGVPEMWVCLTQESLSFSCGLLNRQD